MGEVNKLPQVSVVLPVYNRKDLLPRAIRSVLDQSFREFELIVVDDASTESLREVVDSFSDSRVVYLRQEKNGGPAAARNAGIRAARGDLVAFQDSDDEWTKDKLGLQVKCFHQSPPGTCMVIGGLTRGGSKGTFRYPEAGKLPQGAEALYRVRMDAVAFSQTWLVRRDVLLRAGLYDERLRMWEDWELLMRLALLGGVCCAPGARVLSHLSEDSLSLNLQARISSLRLIIEKQAAAGIADRHFIARLHYLLGRFLCLDNKLAEARRVLLRALVLDPLHAGKAAVLLLASFLGQFGVHRLLPQLPTSTN